MAERKIDKELKESLQKYLAKIAEYYNIDAAYLFGSYAKGEQRENSDIDVAIVSKDVKDAINDMGKMFALTWGIDTRIEPHPFHTSEFRPNETYFIDEIIKTGIKIKLP